MNKNFFGKISLILFFIVIAVLCVFPPQKKLKQGLDLAGGTSLIYEIDTQGLEKEEVGGLSQKMLPILRRRIDPTNVANIVMRPLGDTRIEIQLPVTSKETKDKRQAYQQVLDELDAMNINLAQVKRALTIGGQEQIDSFEKVAAGSEERENILDTLLTIYNQQNLLQRTRDKMAVRLEAHSKIIDDEGFSSDYVKRNAYEWGKLDPSAMAEKIADYAKDNETAKKTITEYVKAYEVWAETVNKLTDPDTGLNNAYSDAFGKLARLNLSTDQITDILEMDENSTKRQDLINTLKTEYPDRADKIELAVTTYKDYRSVGGRLDDPEDLKRMLKGSGVLEFRILPIPGINDVTSGEMAGYLEALKTQGPKLASSNQYVWFQIEDIEDWVKSVRNDAIVGQFGEKYYVLASNKMSEIMNKKSAEVPWKLKKANVSYDDMGLPGIGFTLDDTAAKLFKNITRNNIGSPLCIILDSIAISAPNIKSAIPHGSGIISGTYTQVELDNMINKLNAGSFPARLSDVPISEKTIGSMIGEENRNQGMYASFIGLAAVAVFMCVYYLGAGLVAVIALALNLLFILALMVMLSATFTLPGIAGLILTIGMSVDANVLIFERIREEQERGSSVRTAIANGYARAFRTIFDSNITTFFVALILYMVASEEIKGFAIVLMLGIASSMFTALFVTRVIFDLLVSKRVITKQLKMPKIIRTPNISWMSLRGVFFVISAVLFIGGIFIYMSRDETENSKFDIEFTGGTSAQIDIKEELGFTESDVQERIRNEGIKLGNPALAASKVYSVGTSGNQFEITTTETNKTKATVTFNEPGKETVESVTAAIHSAMKQLGGTLYNLQVSKVDSMYEVSTSQVNKGLVRNILDKAFGEIATVTEPEVIEVVSQAIRDAFEGDLKIRENLGLKVNKVSEIPESEIILADFFGGIMIDCTLKKPTTYDELAKRFEAIRFKSDMRDLSWYSYKIYKTDLNEFADNDIVKNFVYVSVHPDAGYREFSETEWTAFTDNEKAKIQNATSLETTLSRITQIDPSIGRQAENRAVVAIILSLIVIVAYIWIRFGTARYGIAANLALIHDVGITLGAVTGSYLLLTSVPAVANALLIADFKIDLAMIAAFLTIIGYSLNDTIVVFDRIRENRGKNIKVTNEMINKSINQTLSRTLLTSFTTFLVVVIMYIWGGSGLRGFTFAMLVGIIVGTYSSIAIASSFLTLGSKDAGQTSTPANK